MDDSADRVIDLLPGLIWTARSDGRADFVNKRWSDYTGLSVDDACGDGWLSAVHPDDLGNLLKGWRAIMQSRLSGEIEARLRRADGEYRLFLFRASPVTDPAGKIIGWCGVNTDIEDRKRAEQDAAAHERQAQLIIDGLPAIVTLTTPDGELAHANRHLLDYLGETLDALKSRPVGYGFHPADRDEVLERWMHSVTNGQPYDYEARLRRADGVYRWFHTLGFPLRDPKGWVLAWYFLGTDVDDRKRAEALLAGEKQLLQMVATGSPLAGLLEALCRLVEDNTSGLMCSILTLDPSGHRFWMGAGPSLPLELAEHLDGLVVDQTFGPCGMAATLKIQVTVSDPASDPRWNGSPWPELMVRHGLRACWSTPILSGSDAVVGVFNLYRREPGSPPAADLEHIPRFAHLACIAIERSRSDATMQQSEGRKAAILNAALDCIITMDHEGRITEFNPAAERVFGYRADRVLGKTLAELIIPPSLRDLHRQGLARYLATGDSHIIGRHIEITGMRADRSEFPVEITIVRSDQNGPPTFTGFLRDISDRKRSEAALRVSHAHLAEAQKLSSTGSFTWKVSTNEHFWSDEVYRMFEYDTSDDVSLQTILQFAHPNDQVWIDRAIANAAAGQDFETEFRAIMANNVMKHIHVVAHRVHDPDGRLEYVGAIQDVTEHRQSEEALRRSEAFLAEGQRMSGTGSFSWQPQADEILFSVQLRRIFEFEAHTPVTLELIRSRVHPDDMILMTERLEAAGAGDNQDFEVRLRMPDGTAKYVHTVSHGLRGKDGRMEIIGTIQDITDRRRSEDTLSQLRSDLTRIARVTSLGALTASIAHEVNQPLSGIITNASTCLKMLASDPPNIRGAQETARRMVRDGNRAADIIKRLRMLFIKKETTLEPLDLNEAAREVIALSWSDLQRSRLIVRSDFARDLPPVTGDRVQLQQVVLNLLLNAADAMSSIEDRERQILITTACGEDDQVCFKVQDAGVGFDAQSAERLFEAFYTTKSEGMGIGLAVSRTIIENHGGRLWAKPNDGPGATFTFVLPRGTKAGEGVSQGEAGPHDSAIHLLPLMAKRQ